MRLLGASSRTGLASQANMSPKNFPYNVRPTSCALLTGVKSVIIPSLIEEKMGRTKLSSKNVKFLKFLFSRLAQCFSHGGMAQETRCGLACLWRPRHQGPGGLELVMMRLPTGAPSSVPRLPCCRPVLPVGPLQPVCGQAAAAATRGKMPV